MSKELPASNRVLSLDAYRGLVMIAMAVSGFGFSVVVQKREVMDRFANTSWDGPWQAMWKTLAYQFDHVAWTGCGFWDLIQPSFLFLVGVSMPYSYSRREQEGQSELSRFGHVVWRSLVLIALGIFLSSNSHSQTEFTFVNVLTQIGLGYPFLYLLLRGTFRAHLLALILILGGYWAWFATYTIPQAEFDSVRAAIAEHHPKLLQSHSRPDGEWSQFDGFGAHWNKHVNAAAAFDRVWLDKLPREGVPFRGHKFWINNGGYQTLNCIPSLATMLFGLMAGVVLRSDRRDGEKVGWLLKAAAVCFAISMPFDTSIWPVANSPWEWHLSPIVKRIWTPGWAVFSSGWTFLMLAASYWVIEIRQWRRWSWPLAIVGMNSIAMYVMAQLMKPWVGKTFTTHLTTLDALLGEQYGHSVFLFFDSSFPYSPILGNVARVFGLWLICWWMYHRKIFVRI